jgi:hypothetical protein
MVSVKFDRQTIEGQVGSVMVSFIVTGHAPRDEKTTIEKQGIAHSAR